MSGNILLVDAVPTNRIVLKVKLAKAYFETMQASSAEEALRRAVQTPPQAILLGEVDGMDIVELTRRLRNHADLAHVPILALVAAMDSGTRLKVLEAGADDVVNRPVDTEILIARLRCLQRHRTTDSEHALRETTHRALGMSEAAAPFDRPARIGLVRMGNSGGRDLGLAAGTRHQVSDIALPDLLSGAAFRGETPPPDVFVLDLPEGCDGTTALQLLPDLRSRPQTRHALTLVCAPESARHNAGTILDLGASDLVRTRDTDPAELHWRLERLVRRKAKADRMRGMTRDGLRAAVTDPLTELYNRRYAIPHLQRIAERAQSNGTTYAVMLADIDHFKTINDTHGHAAGDRVLVGVAARLRDQVRAVDLVARYGGEEFLVVMPDTNTEAACSTARRLCEVIGKRPFETGDGADPVHVTISIGISIGHHGHLAPSDTAMALGQGAGLHANVQGDAGQNRWHTEDVELLIGNADHALYEAKAHGRNTVELHHSKVA